MNDTVPKKVAALPQHSAERLCLSVAHSNEIRREAAPRVLTLVLLLLTAPCSLLTVVASPWTRQPSGTMAWLHSVYFLDRNQGWVAGSNGTLLTTTDGGTTWKKLSTLTKDTLQDVYFADQEVGWLIATCDILKLKTNEPAPYPLKTEHGGTTLRQVPHNS